ncbi:ABC transporter ATP-binding protein [Sphingosinicella rhizophila]|nr:ABC transporter ATP-binding protein [Sphingosinicella sp. GR2756]
MIATHPSIPAVLQAIDLSKWLPLGDTRIDILNSVSLEVVHGEWVAVTGPSGSGKSTLLGLLAGLDEPSGGEVRLSGQNLFDAPEPELARMRNRAIGIVFQSFHLIPTLTACENVEVPMQIGPDRANASRRARELLEMVGLGDRLHHRPFQLSGGQQQRVAIARSLANSPDLILADEPTGNLDSKTATAILDLFDRLKRDLGLTIVMITHDPGVAARADRTITIVDGRVAAPPQ